MRFGVGRGLGGGGGLAIVEPQCATLRTAAKCSQNPYEGFSIKGKMVKPS
jgi:hypothetical protein